MADRMRGRGASSRAAWAVMALALLFETGCAAHWAYRKGQGEARRGNWDLAVARFSRALQKDPDNIGFKIALENARIQASRQHYDVARRHLLAEELTKAAEELQIAANYDPGNKSASDDLAIVQDRIRLRDLERRRMSEYDTVKARAQASPGPLPVLSPQSNAPISIKFENTSLQKILETMGRLAGVNVLFDSTFRDKTVSVDLRNETFQNALDRLTFINRLFYKILDPSTIIVVDESAAKRRTYDERVLRTFYLENAETKDVETLIKTGIGSQTLTVVSNAPLGAITVFGTPDEIAVAERLVGLHDKARGEVMVELEILEVNRNRIKQYGIELSNYSASATFAPTGTPGEDGGNVTNLRAQVLSSLNVSDFVLSIPRSVLVRFLQNEDTTRILANPRLRAAEGKKTSLRIGTEVPIPVTTFTATQAGTSTFAPATSFNYKNVGINLEITPRVNPNGDITLEMDAEFSSIGADRNVGTGANPLNVPTFLTRKVTGTLRLHDGETTLLGGLLQGVDTDTFAGILGVQSIPILNKIFTSREKARDDQEIMMSITPHLVRAPKVTAADLQSVLIGTRELTRMGGGARPQLGVPEDQLAPPLGLTPSPAAPAAPAPTPPLGGPAPGSLSPPVPPPGAPPIIPPASGVGPPAGVAPPVQPAPSPSPAPLAGVPEVEPPATIGGSPGAVAPASGPSPQAGAPGGVAAAVLSPAEIRIPVGGTGTVGLVVMGAQDLRGVDMTLTFDPAVLEAQDVAPGPLLTLDGSPVGVNRGMESGRVRAQFTRVSGSAGSGVVATVTFRALRAGVVTATVEALSLTTGTSTTRVPVAAVSRIRVAQ
jgi:general secretion pathway protein D